jgi:CHAT domain-containing protein
VVSSLWNVEDKSTSTLMRGFHEEVARGSTPDEALRRARSRMVAIQQTSHPYYWAAFGITGNPGKLR